MWGGSREHILSALFRSLLASRSYLRTYVRKWPGLGGWTPRFTCNLPRIPATRHPCPAQFAVSRVAVQVLEATQSNTGSYLHPIYPKAPTKWSGLGVGTPRFLCSLPRIPFPGPSAGDNFRAGGGLAEGTPRFACTLPRFQNTRPPCPGQFEAYGQQHPACCSVLQGNPIACDGRSQSYASACFCLVRAGRDERQRSQPRSQPSSNQSWLKQPAQA